MICAPKMALPVQCDSAMKDTQMSCHWMPSDWWLPTGCPPHSQWGRLRWRRSAGSRLRCGSCTRRGCFSPFQHPSQFEGTAWQRRQISTHSPSGTYNQIVLVCLSLCCSLLVCVHVCFILQVTTMYSISSLHNTIFTFCSLSSNVTVLVRYV